MPNSQDRLFANYANLVELNSAALRPSAAFTFKNARERLQILAITSLVFFGAMRAGDICPDAEYPNHFTVQWKDILFFVHQVVTPATRLRSRGIGGPRIGRPIPTQSGSTAAMYYRGESWDPVRPPDPTCLSPSIVFYSTPPVGQNPRPDSIELSPTPLATYRTTAPGYSPLASHFSHRTLRSSDPRGITQVNGQMTLAVIVTLRYLKGEKFDQNILRQVLLNARPDIPTCVDHVRILSILACWDGAILDVTRPAHLEVLGMAPPSLDPSTKRFGFEINHRQKETAVFCTVNGTGGECSPFVTLPDMRWDVGLVKKCFDRLQNLSMPKITFKAMQRMSAALLNRQEITEADTCHGMGRTFKSTERMAAYLPSTQNFDLMGLAIGGRQDLESVQWVGIPLSRPEAFRLTAAEEAAIQQDERVKEARDEVSKCHAIMTQAMTPSEARQSSTPEYLK